MQKFEIFTQTESAQLLLLQHKLFYKMHFAAAFIPILWGINCSECTKGYQVSKSPYQTMIKGLVSQGSLNSKLGVCGFLGQNLSMVPERALIQKHHTALYFRSTGFKTLSGLKINFHISTHIEVCCLPSECGQMVCRKETPPICSEFQFSESIICLALVRSQLE